MKRTMGFSMAVLLIAAGCGATAKNEPASPEPTVEAKTPARAERVSMDTADTAKTIATQDDRVDEAAAVAIGKELSVALKVSNFNRLRLKSIRQDVHQTLTDQFPKHTIHVTTDSKLFSELQKLEKGVKRNWPPKPPKQKKYKKTLQKINEDMKG